MTDKLKCPFCQQELIREGMNHWWCSCNIEHQGKELYGTTALWQALIDGKKAQDALKVAVDALNDIVSEHEGLDGEIYACSGIASRALIKINEITSTTKG